MSYKKWTLGFGRQYSYLLNMKGSVHYLQYNSNTDYTSEFGLNDEFRGINRSNFSFVTNISFEPMKNLKLEVRFINGVTNLAIMPYNYTANTRQFLFGVSYQLEPFKKEEETEKLLK